MAQGQRRCETCACYVSTGTIKRSGKTVGIGACKRYPHRISVLTVEKEGEIKSLEVKNSPIHDSDDWCMEWIQEKDYRVIDERRKDNGARSENGSERLETSEG